MTVVVSAGSNSKIPQPVRLRKAKMWNSLWLRNSIFTHPGVVDQYEPVTPTALARISAMATPQKPKRPRATVEGEDSGEKANDEDDGIGQPEDDKDSDCEDEGEDPDDDDDDEDIKDVEILKKELDQMREAEALHQHCSEPC